MDDRKIEARLNALGMNDVMDALDRLVKSATVGGKEALTNSKKTACRNLADDVWTIYVAFCDAGFDRAQAFALTMEMVKSFNRKEELS